jgi:hypothetical protein
MRAMLPIVIGGPGGCLGVFGLGDWGIIASANVERA